APGPVTVFQDGVYAGDALLGHLQPGEERLLAYAVDLDLVAARRASGERQEVQSITARRGVLHVTRRQRREAVYTFRHQAAAPKTVLADQPIEAAFHLVAPEKPLEQTADRYRFAVQVPAKGTAELKVVTERPVAEAVALDTAGGDVLAEYAKGTGVSP